MKKCLMIALMFLFCSICFAEDKKPPENFQVQLVQEQLRSIDIEMAYMQERALRGKEINDSIGYMQEHANMLQTRKQALQKQLEDLNKKEEVNK
jgi:hypothetical protein